MPGRGGNSLESDKIGSQSKRTVSAIVVTCGVKDYLSRCVGSLYGQAVPPEEIIVIDNSLKPGFASSLAKDHPQIKLVTNSSNKFYCESLNQGIALSRGGFVLCLNDDVVLDEDFIRVALDAFLKPGVGMVSGKLMRDDASTIDSSGLFLSPWLTAHERGYGRKDKGQFQREGYIFGVNGAAAFYSRDMLEDIKDEQGYFDPDFRIFFEDLDVSWRANRAGWKCYYAPGAVAYHVRGGTVRRETGQGKAFARKYLNDSLHADLLKNRYLAIIKNGSVLGLLARIPCLAFYEAALWSYLLIFKPSQIKMFFSNLSILKKALRKRRSRTT